MKKKEVNSGRHDLYVERVKPRFEEIEKWIQEGATEKQVASALGIGYTAFNNYKVRYKEFSDFLKNIDRGKIIVDLKSALLKKALGFTYEEEKKYVKTDPKTGLAFNYVEIQKCYCPPDVAAINLMLKNLDKDWSNDPKNDEFKRMELELRKQSLEKDNF